MFIWIDYLMEIFGLKRAELNDAETAAYIGSSISTLRAYRGERRYKRVPEIPFHKREGRYFYYQSDLDRWMESRGW